MIGVFKKYKSNPQHQSRQIVLDNPGDMGNLGTIMRTMLGFDIKNLVLTLPCVDYFNPKVIRSSMGAIFSLDIIEYNSLKDFLKECKNRKYLFMLNGKNNLGEFKTPHDNYALVFGNEARGLDNKLLEADGESVVIKHTNNIDH